jgi:hypothetical protein
MRKHPAAIAGGYGAYIGSGPGRNRFDNEYIPRELSRYRNTLTGIRVQLFRAALPPVNFAAA